MLRRRFLLVACPIVVLTACGSRSWLPAMVDDAGPEPAAHDGGADARPPGRDAGPPEMDAASAMDVLPPIDVTPPVDVTTHCPDAAATLVYLLTQNATLLTFQPPSTFTTIGRLMCRSASMPNSMAVDRVGIAYVGFLDGSLFRVSTLTGTCQPTAFSPGTFAPVFGMGFAADSSGIGETLYLAESFEGSADAGGPPRLAWVDTTTFALHVVGAFTPPIAQAELTGTGAGDLFAFYKSGATDSAIGQIDKVTAQVTAQSVLPGVLQGSGWAFAFWGGDFYTFTSPVDAGSVVHRFVPGTNALSEIAKYPEVILGAGVSTCAPQR